MTQQIAQTTKISLDYPIEFGGQTFEFVTMRRSTLIDYINNQELKGLGDQEQAHYLFANLCEESPDFFAEMDYADIIKLQNAVEEYLETVTPDDKSSDIAFDFPLVFGEGEKQTTISSTTIRRAKGKDQIENEKLECSPARKEGYLLARLTDMSFKNICQLDMSDYLKIKERYLSFLKSKPTTFKA
jgi:hypothetical protein